MVQSVAGENGSENLPTIGAKTANIADLRGENSRGGFKWSANKNIIFQMLDCISAKNDERTSKSR
ncbi:hypothetical protein [Tateyamaria sp. ANG-S1]|uniref:hypothetical protein n=1 Tax=Tateyamaria sp. ANG-S1 TaxID=1577905 RepID=UPI00126A7532|nr:hypothetical protein [Tateyamaria sp. ANG-S1]